MAEPDMHKPASRAAQYGRTREEILAAARPLPPHEEMIIHDLTEEEERLFTEAIFSEDELAFLEAHRDE